MDIFGYRNSDVSRYICRARDRLVRMTISNRILSVRNSSGESLHVLFETRSKYKVGDFECKNSVTEKSTVKGI